MTEPRKITDRQIARAIMRQFGEANSHYFPNVHFGMFERDLLRVMKSGYVHEFEFKRSKGDFKKDFQKTFPGWANKDKNSLQTKHRALQTGEFELPEWSRRHIEQCVDQFGWTDEIIQATAEGPPSPTKDNGEILDNWRDGNTAYEELVLNHGFGGPPLHPRMYQRLKERQLLKLRQKIAKGKKRGGRLVVLSGIRHDESAIRAGYKRSWKDEPKQGMLWINPFYYRTKADFDIYRDEFSLPRNPVKAKCGISEVWHKRRVLLRHVRIDG